MFAYLRGKVATCEENYIVVDVNGVGYELICTAGAIFKFASVTEEVTIPTYMQVREDAVTLFGFADNLEKNMFLKLITVSGVGPKMAVTILSGMTEQDLCIAIATEDAKMLSKIKGLGRKTAEKIIVELREKVGNIDTSKVGQIGTTTKEVSQEAIEDACLALTTLGLSNGEALKLVNKLAQEGDSAETIIKRCLKDMAR